MIPNTLHEYRGWVKNYQLKKRKWGGHEGKCHRKKAGTRCSESLAWGELCVLEFFVATAPEGATDWPKTTKEWRTLAQGRNKCSRKNIKNTDWSFGLCSYLHSNSSNVEKEDVIVVSWHLQMLWWKWPTNDRSVDNEKRSSEAAFID